MALPNEPKRVLITGAAGQIGYALLPFIARGDMLGPDQPVILHLLEIEAALKALEGIKMELEDCSFPLLKGVVCTHLPEEAFKDIDYVVFVGAFPRKQGMERNDLIEINASIFSEQGKALDKYAKKTVKVLVVGNPANTNCLITLKNAPSIPKQNFSALTRLDHNRARNQVAQKAGVPVQDVKNVVIWGNHSSTQFPDARFGTVSGKNALTVINDNNWVQHDFVDIVQQRGAKVIAARGLSSAFSAAKAIIDHMRDWVLGTPEGEYVSMAVLSNGQYGVTDELIFSYPVTCKNGEFKIVESLEIDEFAKSKLDITKDELVKEKAVAFAKVGLQ